MSRADRLEVAAEIAAALFGVPRSTAEAWAERVVRRRAAAVPGRGAPGYTLAEVREAVGRYAEEPRQGPPTLARLIEHLAMVRREVIARVVEREQAQRRTQLAETSEGTAAELEATEQAKRAVQWTENQRRAQEMVRRLMEKM